MAFVLSSLSGNLISAASAGYAPTNSADVSAIASAYQVVSATATQLNAGTAYVTSINETPISAARAGNAANASLANSAWYDGTGRLISSLPDEATVSSIASSYVESAVSSKLDESATADFYSTSNPSGFITGVDLSNYATTAYVDSSISSFVDSAYVESQVSSKEDKLTFGYDDDKISAINGSALAGQGGGGVDSATVSAIASAYVESGVSGKQDTITYGYNSGKISSIDGSGIYIPKQTQVVTSLQYATSESATVASTVTADTAVGYGARDISAEYYDYGYSPWTDYDSSSPLIKVRMSAEGNMVNYSSYPYYLYMVPYGATNYGNVSNTGGLTGARNYGYFSGDMNDFIIAEGTASASNPYYVEVTFDVTHVPFVGSLPAFWGTDTDVPGMYVVDDSENARPVFCVAGGYDGYELFELRGKVTAEMDFGSIVTVSAVSGINELGIAGAGGGGVDSATVSAIASSYAADVSAAASGAVSAVSSNSANWLKLSSFSGVDGIVTAVGSSYGFGVSASAFMGIDSALKGTTGTISGSEPYIYYTAQLPDGVSNAVILSSVDVAADTVDIYYKDYNDYTLSVSLDSNLRQKAIVTNATGILTAMSHNSAFQIGFTAKQPEALAFQSDLTGAGVDSATVSAIASSYAESAVSAVSGDYYSTSNPSGFITSAPFDSATCSAIASSYAESAVSSVSGNYYTTANESGYALSSDVSGTVDLVSTQSANWGGSALALSAGPGVSLTKSGNVLVAGLDETLLWSGSLAAVDNATLTASSSPTDYRSIKFVFEGYADNQRAPQELYFSGCDKEFDIMPIGFIGTGIRLSHVRLKFAGTVGTFSETVQYQVTTTISTSVDRPYLRAIYGINHTAGV